MSKLASTVGFMPIFRHPKYVFLSMWTLTAYTPNLGNWVQTQRANRDKMSEERKARLDSIGFQWSARGQSRDQSNSQEEAQTRVRGLELPMNANLGGAPAEQRSGAINTIQHLQCQQ